jgi:asparagine synthase (glutamine-hydrolysing)
MNASMASRGPDGLDLWSQGSVGLGHALLRSTRDTADERQPASLDGRVWITADARIDGRAELLRKLEARGRTLESTSDAHLILHAYHAWGDACVEHLLGDFAFAIWDQPRRRLFCGRDHFGIKPFFYARIADGMVFGNTLDCIRQHPQVGSALNQLAVGDFLLFGWNLDPATTTFEDISRLPAAHTLTWEAGTLCTRRYWAVPANGHIRYRRSQEYVDHFTDVLRAAVADRLRIDKVGVWMSGGLDSTAVTAIAHRLLSERGEPFAMRGHTIVYDSLIPDEERRFAALAAEALGVESDYLSADRCEPFEAWDRPDLSTPEPTDDPFLLIHIQYLRRAAAHSPVLLCGEGGDEVLWPSTVLSLSRRMPVLNLAGDVARSLVFHHRRPPVGIRAWLKRWLGEDSEIPPFPSWVEPAFASRLDLQDRWRRFNAPEAVADDAVRAEACGRLATGPWSWYFEFSDPGVTRIPVESRYPFFDVRLVGTLLAMPPLPWFVDKHLLRLAMRGVLPESVRLRPKAPLGGDPLSVHLRSAGARRLDRFEPTMELQRSVNRTAVPPLDGGGNPWLNIRPLCLNYWLDRASCRGEAK